MTDKRIVYKTPDGMTAVVTPVPWSRSCSSIVIKGETVKIDPPRAIDLFLGRVVSADEFCAMQIEFAETESTFLDRVAAKAVPEGAAYRIVDAADIPTGETERQFRAALKPDLSFDMDKARAIHRDRIRAARQPRLDHLDRLHNRALGQKKTKESTAIETERQALREATDNPAIDAAKTLVELTAAWPAL